MAIVGFSPLGCTAGDLWEQLAGGNEATRRKITAACYKLREDNELTWNGTVIDSWTVLMKVQ